MIRAYIAQDLLGRSVAISLLNETEDGAYPSAILRIAEGSPNGLGYRWEALEGPPNTEIEPTLRLGDSEARALLDALTRHYNGAEDTRALRRDYDAERKRADQLIATLGVVATKLADTTPLPPVERVYDRSIRPFFGVSGE